MAFLQQQECVFATPTKICTGDAGRVVLGARHAARRRVRSREIVDEDLGVGRTCESEMAKVK